MKKNICKKLFKCQIETPQKKKLGKQKKLFAIPKRICFSYTT